MADPRITFNSVNIDLKKGTNGLLPIPRQRKYENDSSSGKIETINLFGRWEYTFDAFFSQAVYYTLWAWWAWARQGQEWAFALDSSNTGDTTLDASAASGQKVIPVASTGSFSVGDICFVKAIDEDNEFELVEIYSISAGVSVTAVSNLIYSYSSSDILRHKDYFPSVISMEETFEPRYTGVKDVTGKYYQHTFRFVEAL